MSPETLYPGERVDRSVEEPLYGEKGGMNGKSELRGVQDESFDVG